MICVFDPDDRTWLDRREIAAVASGGGAWATLRRWIRDWVVRLQWGPVGGDPRV